MNMVGVHIFVALQCRQAFLQTLTRCPPLAVGAVNTRNTQNTGAHTTDPAKMAHRQFRIDPALCTCRLRQHGTCFAHPRTAAIAIHPAGGAIHQRAWLGSPQQYVHQCPGAAIHCAVWRGRCQVHHLRRQPRQTPHMCRFIQITQQRHQPHCPQSVDPIGTGGKGEHPYPVVQQSGNACTHIATPNDEQPLTAESSGPGAQRGLI